MIKTHEIKVGTGDRSKELADKVNEFVKENGISEKDIIGTSWRQPFIADLVYREAVGELKVQSAKITGKSTIISFSTGLIVCMEDILQVVVDEEEHYFEVKELDIEKSGLLNVTAVEIGNSRELFCSNKSFNIRKLIDTEIEVVADKDRANEIKRRASQW